VSDTRAEVRRKCHASVTAGTRTSALIPERDAKSSHSPMCEHRGRRSLQDMKQRLLFVLLFSGLLVLALGGWTVRGVRWAASGGRARGVPQPA
jgi:hypothetical protein